MQKVISISQNHFLFADAMGNLVGVVQDLSRAKTFDEIADIVRKSARELTSADGATFVLREDNNCYYADENAISPLWKGQRFPMSRCVSGWVMMNAQPAIIEDIYQDPRVPIEAYRPTFVKSMLMVPIREEGPIGAIGNYWAEHHNPTPEEISILQTLANITAVAIENVRLNAEIEKKSAAAENTYAALGNFAWIAAHDLQAPLRAIKDIAKWINESFERKQYKEAQEHTELLKGRIERMERVLKSILDYAQVEYAFDPHNQLNTLNGADLIENVLEFAEVPKDFEVHTNEFFKRISLPQMPLQEIFSNIIGYAVKHHDRKKKGLIAIDGEENETGYVFTISDNGPGIDPAQYDKIFEIFHVLKTQASQDSGLGLALVKKVLEVHGGSITVNSVLGRGTTFVFTWPKKAKS